MAGSDASLRRRAAAFALDYLLVAGWIVAVTLIGVALRALAPDVADGLFGSPVSGELAGFVSLTLPVAGYFAVSEAGPQGATWGKRRLGIRVVPATGEDTRDVTGRRIGLGRSILRTALKFLPWELAHALIWRYAFPGSAPMPLLDAGLVLVWALVGANLASAVLDPRRRTLYDHLSATAVVSD